MEEHFLGLVECMVYMNIINIIIINYTAVFMKSRKDTGIPAQVHAIHRVRLISFHNELKEVKHDIVPKKYCILLKGMYKESKFLRFIQPE